MMHQLQGSNSVHRRHARSLDAAAAAAARKQPWYKRALGRLIPWARRPSAAVAAPAAERRPRWWSCAPLCSYDGILLGVHVDAVGPTRISAPPSPPPRRRASPTPSWPGAVEPVVEGAWAVPCPSPPVRRRRRGSPISRLAPAAAVEVEGPRRSVSFSGGESLWNDELMRRFMLAQEEGAPLRRGGMGMVACRHCGRRWRAPGKSRLRRMSLPHVAEDEAGEINGDLFLACVVLHGEAS